MRIIVWGINFAPELTGIAPFNTGLCDYLRERGHVTEMVTTFPYYPFWRKIPGDRGRLYRTDDFDGVRVHRCWHYVPRRVTTLRRIWHEFSFGLTSFVRMLFLARADVYIVVSPPLILGPLAAFIGWLKRRPFVFHVQDLQPDAAVGLGMVRPGHFTRLLYRIEALSYRRAALVSGISRAMLEAFAKKGVPKAKCYLFPNWIRWYGRNSGVVQDNEERRTRARNFRRKFAIPSGVFLATYAGNLGRKQGLDTLIQAAKLLAGQAAVSKAPGKDGLAGAMRDASTAEGPEILILIVGDGVMRSALEAVIAAAALHNIRVMPLLIETDYHGMLAASDVGLILQAPGTGRVFLPSKLLSVLSLRVPVVCTADDDSELANAVREGGFGVNLPAADPQALSATLAQLAGAPARVAEMGQKAVWVERFSGPKVLGDFEQALLHLVKV